MRKIKLKRGKTFPNVDQIIKAFAGSFDKFSILSSVRDDIAAAIDEYDNLGANKHQQSIKPCRVRLKKSLIACYEVPTVAASKLLSCVKDFTVEEDSSICAYCGINENPELDHYLPKNTFPYLSLHPKNLVPICSVCNKKKGTRYESRGSRMFLYPLLDEFVNNQCLSATVNVFARSVKISFSLDRNPHLTDEEYSLLSLHFKNLDLENRYKKKSVSYIARLRRKFRENAMTPRQKLRSLRRSLEIAREDEHINHWKIATLEALLTQINHL